MKIQRLNIVMGLIFALALVFAGCGGGMVGTVDAIDDGGDGTTPSGTYAEFEGKAVIVHFEAPIALDASASKAAGLANFTLAEDLSGQAAACNRVVFAPDGSWAKFFCNIRYQVNYKACWTGITLADGTAVPDGCVTAESPPNPMSLSDGFQADFLFALFGRSMIFDGDSFAPPSADDNVIPFFDLLYELMLTGTSSGRYYVDPFTDSDCDVGSPGFSLTIPQFQQVDYRTYMVGRYGTADACQDIFTVEPPVGNPGRDVSVGKIGQQQPGQGEEGGQPLGDERWSFFYFEDMAAGPAAEFVAHDDGVSKATFVIAFPLVRPSGRIWDFNGDGVADFGFIETRERADTGKAFGLTFSYYTYMRIFFGREPGGFNGPDGKGRRVYSDEADVTIPITGFVMSKAIYENWTGNIEFPMTLLNFPYYPSVGVGNLNGDINAETGKGLDDLAVSIYDSDKGKMLVRIWMGSPEQGVREEPDSEVEAKGKDGLYNSNMIPTIFIANLNGDSRDDTAAALDDLIVGVTSDMDPVVSVKGLMAEPTASEAHIIFGRNPWPASISTVPANTAEMNQHAMIVAESPADGYAMLNFFNILADDFNNDGYHDLVIGAPMMTPVTLDLDEFYRGEVYLYLGEDGMGASTDWDARDAVYASATFTGAKSNDSLGLNDMMLGTVMYVPGDLFNDGRPDLFVVAGRSTPGAMIYVFDIDEEVRNSYGPANAYSIVNVSMVGGGMN